MQPEQCGVRMSAQAINIMQEQMLKLRTLSQQPQQNSISEEVRKHLIAHTPIGLVVRRDGKEHSISVPTKP